MLRKAATVLTLAILALIPSKGHAHQSELDCLARNIYFEARGEPYSGKVAVAMVTRNRVNSRYYPHTYCEVVYQRFRNTCQFSWACAHESYLIITEDRAWRRAKRIARDVLLLGKKHDIIGYDVYHFHAHYVSPNWANSMTRVATIGNHIFYRK